MLMLARLALVAVLVAPFPTWADVTGPARVIDGDTLEAAGRRGRLFGIDAPEARQTCGRAGAEWPCGREAAKALRDRIGAESLTCRERDRDRYRRIVAVCYLAGVDLGHWLVSEGWALAYRHYSLAYVPAENGAREAGRGVWTGRFAAPWEWRRKRR